MLDRARTAGITRILVPGYDLASSERALELAAAHPDLLDAAVGIHPHHVGTATSADWSALYALAADRRSVAVGEIGLDFFRNLSDPDAQRDGFARQLDLAARLGRPVIVHDREAHAAVTDALLAWAPSSGRTIPGMLHCFSGDEAMAARLAGAGFLISFALPVTFANSLGPRRAAATLAADQILVETDSPWLGLDPRGRNEPTTTLRTASAVARLRDEAAEVMARRAGEAYARLVS